jgi:hypothetical protein
MLQRELLVHLCKMLNGCSSQAIHLQKRAWQYWSVNFGAGHMFPVDLDWIESPQKGLIHFPNNPAEFLAPLFSFQHLGLRPLVGTVCIKGVTVEKLQSPQFVVILPRVTTWFY